MTQIVRLFLSVEAAAFGFAALIHSGTLVSGYQHSRAATAETVIAVVLLAGWAVTLASPHLSRLAGLAAQAFALLGTCVGIVMIAIGVGPQSALDVVLHAGFVTMLVAGLLVVARRRVDLL
jgi:hypothetical protein